MNRDGSKTRRRAYRPAIEALETLNLLSVAPPLPLAPLVGAGTWPAAPALEPASIDSTAWDAALEDSSVDSLFAPAALAIETAPDAESIASGLDQLQRYLSRSWYRAGLSPQQHDDCTQAVFATLLQNLGRERFDLLAGEVGQFGIREVLSRETAEGPDFFRAIDTVKKRAQREKTYQPIDTIDVAADSTSSADAWRGALDEAITQTLNAREAALVYATLKGETPAEIAQQWGVAPKTVSNEKTRVLQKLRDALLTELLD